MSRVLRVGVGSRPRALRVLRTEREQDREFLAPLLDLRRREAELESAAARHREAAALLEEAARRIPAIVAERLDAVSAEAARFGIAVVAGVAQGAIDTAAFDPAAVVRHALDRAVSGSDAEVVEVRLHPADVGTLQDRAPASGVPSHVRLVADGELERGAVRVVTTAGSFRYALREAIAEIVDRLVRGLGATPPESER